MHKLHNQKPVNLDSVVIEPRYSSILNSDNPEMQIDDIPVIWASSDPATGTFEIAETISDSDTNCGVMLSTRYDIDELYDFFFKGRKNVAVSIGDTEQQLNKWKALKSKLPSGKIQWVNLVSKTNNTHSVEYIYKVAKFKEENQNVKIIAGPVADPTATRKLFEVGVEVVRVGFDSRFDSQDYMETGIAMPHASCISINSEIARNAGKHIFSSGHYTDTADISKSICLGATGVEISEMFYGHEESFGRTETIDGKMFKNDTQYNGQIINTAIDMQRQLSKSCKFAGYKTLKSFRDSASIIII
jgi:hypothetical protein|tara:strand:+ start:2658 stop:3563 length:906 start_codon:yes stop_codon:yes gene_type:complete